MTNILVQFDIKTGECGHRDFYLFKKTSSSENDLLTENGPKDKK